MKLTTRNLIIVLIALIAVFAVVQLTKRGTKSESLRSELVRFDTARVSKVVVQSPEGEVMLSKEGQQWSVLLPSGQAKATKKGVVASLLNSLSTIEPGRLAARKEDKWKDYAVDSTGTRVTVYEGDKPATDIVIGRFGMEGQRNFYSFVRLAEDTDVYVANGFMGMSIGKKPSDFRDNIALRLKKDSLTSIRFNYPDSAFILTKGEKWYLEDQEADSASVVTYLSGLSYLTSSMFYDENLLANPSHIVTFSFSNQDDISVEGYFQNGEMVTKSSANLLEVFQDKKITEKVFKGKNAFLPTTR